MTTLRDRVRSALGRTAPNEREASAELDRILERARPSPRRYALALAYAAAAIVLLVVLFRLGPPRPAPDPRADRGSHLYIHVSGEPPESALAIDLTSSPSGAR